MNHSTNHRSKKPIIWLASGATAAGLALGIAGVAHADNNSSSTTTPSSNTTTSDPANVGTRTPPADPATLPNGPGETVLTGDTAAQVTAAVNKALPGSTIIRVETDSSGHVYEAHVKKADGTVVTLYFNASFAADGQDTGFGGKGPGGPGHDGHGHRGPRGQHGASSGAGAQGGQAPSSQSAPQTRSGGSA